MIIEGQVERTIEWGGGYREIVFDSDVEGKKKAVWFSLSALTENSVRVFDAITPGQHIIAENVADPITRPDGLMTFYHRENEFGNGPLIVLRRRE